MTQKQKTVRTISIIEIVAGLIYIVEGMIVSSGSMPYYIAGVFTVITAIICFMAAKDSSKAKLAVILLWIAIVIGLAGGVIALIGKAGSMNIGLAAVDVCIAAYLIRLIKQIHM